jgi:hypothetical protein
MRPALTKVVAASLAALLVGATATTSEAAFRMGGRGWHGGGAWHGGGWGGRGGWHGGWGPGVVGGLAAGAIIGGALAAPYAYGYGYDGCYQYQPIYGPDGAYLGRQLVNVCY